MKTIRAKHSEFNNGELVKYVRAGSYGSYEAKVISKTDNRIRIHVLTWCGSSVKENWFANVVARSLRKYTD